MESDLTARIREIAAAVAGEASSRDPGWRGVVEAAAGSLGSALDRWGRSATVRRALGGIEHDLLVGEGERVTLSAHLGLSRRLDPPARFRVGDAVEEATRVGDEIHASFQAPPPGCHPVRVDSRSPHVATALSTPRTLHVAGRRPVALVDGALLLPDAPLRERRRVRDALLELRETFELAYFDLHEDNRYAQIRAAIDELELPLGAVMIHAARESELRSAGLVFVDMFTSTGIRGLRARGVPVTTVLTRRVGASARSRSEGLVALPPAEALARHRRGERPEVERAEQMLRARARTSPLEWRLDQTTDSRAMEGNTFDVELDNHEARSRLFEAIDHARSSIHLQLYMVRPGRFTDHLVVRLIRRARHGVAVRVLVDALYSDQEVFGRLNAAIQSLAAEPGVDVVAVSPIASREQVSLPNLKRRDHRKLLIVDGRRAFVSGRNASDEYYTGFDEVPVHDHTRHEEIPWLDAHVEISGPLVAEVQGCFLDTWREQAGPHVAMDDAVLPPLERTDGATGRLVVHRGLRDTNGLAMYEAMFDAASDHIYVVNDFPFVPSLERALRRALARGVRVQLLTGCAAARRFDGTFFPAPLHRTLFEYMVKGKLELLIRDGLEAFELVTPPSDAVVARGGAVRPYVHAKLVSVDGRLCSVGSANLDVTASYWESEANVLVEDAALARRVEDTLRGWIARGVRLDLESEYWKRERAQRAVVATLWPATLYS